MTKRELKTMAEEIAVYLDARKSRVFEGTWMDRRGVSITIHFDSRDDGNRVVVHKWDNEDTCEVRRIFGSFWRPRRGREGVEIAKSSGVPFDVENIVEVAMEW